MKRCRSLLFVPGNKPSWMEKAPGSGVDGLILDLEDSVVPEEKPSSRVAVRQALERLKDVPQIRLVRVNDISSGLTGTDLDAVVCSSLDAIVLPKVENAEDIIRVDTLLSFFEQREELPPGKIEVVVTPETAQGILNAYDICRASARVVGIVATGAEHGDVAREVGYKWTPEGYERLYLQSRIIMAARAAKVEQIFTFGGINIDDLDLLREQMTRDWHLGCTGAQCIHPKHVPTINQVFGPTPEEIEYWQGLIKVVEEAQQQGVGAMTYRGKHVHYHMIEEARQVLDLARQFQEDKTN